MKNLETLILVTLIVLFQSCSKDDNMKVVDDSPPQEVVTIESFLFGEINGVGIDSIFIDCENSIQLTTNTIFHNDSSFLMRQGIKIELDDSLSVWGNIYVFDKIVKPNALTISILKNYFEQHLDKVIFDLEVKFNSQTYRNHSAESLIFSGDFLGNLEKIAEDQTSTIAIESSVSMNCYGEMEILPLIINYSGELKSADLSQNINVNNIHMRINLREL